MTNHTVYDRLLADSDDVGAKRRAAIAKGATQPNLSDRELRSRGFAAELNHFSKTSLQHFDASHSRVEFGTVSVEHGQIMVSLDRSTNILSLHGHEVAMSDIAHSTRTAIFATAAYFAAAEDQEESVTARTILAGLIDAAMQRDRQLSRKVRQALDHERYGS